MRKLFPGLSKLPRDNEQTESMNMEQLPLAKYIKWDRKTIAESHCHARTNDMAA